MSETILNMLPLTEEEKPSLKPPHQTPSTSTQAAVPPRRSSLPRPQ